MPNPKRRIFYIIIIFLIIVVFYLLFFRTSKVNVTVFKTTRGKVEYTVTATTTGTVESDLQAIISSKVFGKIREMLVQENDFVEKEQVAVLLDKDELQAQLDLAQANYKSAEARLKSLKTTLDLQKKVVTTSLASAEADFELAKMQLERQRDLVKDGFLSQQQLDLAEREYKVAKSRYEQAVARKKEIQIQKDEVAAAEAAVEQAQASVTVAELQLKETIITCPFSGLVSAVYREKGEVVTANTPLFMLVNLDDIYIRTTIDEVDIHTLKEGQKALVTFDAFQGKPYKAYINEISPLVSLEKREGRTSVVKLIMAENDIALKPGMSADVEILVDEKQDVVYLPTDAIMEDNKKQFVYVINHSRIAKTYIETGLYNWDRTEIMKGVKEGDLVIVSLDNPAVVENARVKITEIQ